MILIRSQEFFDSPLHSFIPTGRPAGYWRGALEIGGRYRKVAFATFGQNHGECLALGEVVEDDGETDILVARVPWAPAWYRVPRLEVEKSLAAMRRAADVFFPGHIVEEGFTVPTVPGWNIYTGSVEVPAPRWAPEGTDVWWGAGGVVVAFPDGTGRHIRPAKEWFCWPHQAVSGPGLVARQGDVFITDYNPWPEGSRVDVRVRVAEVKPGATLGRHVVGDDLVLYHQEHEDVQVSEGTWLLQLPGRSRRALPAGD